MEASDRLSRMFSYDLWANKLILTALQENRGFNQATKAIQLFAHIAAAQELWYQRIEDLSFDKFNIWPDYGLPVASQTLNTLAPKWKTLIIQNHPALDRLVSYQNSKGTAFQTMLSDILNHIVIHGQHHRAQIASMLRNAKVVPPATDFIYFSRAN